MTDEYTAQIQVEYDIRRRIDEYLDQMILDIEGLVNETELCGNRRLGVAQFTGLQNLLRETGSIQVPLNWIKYQIGRYSAWREGDFGKEFLSALEGLEDVAIDIVAGLYKVGVAEVSAEMSKNNQQVTIQVRSIWKRLINQYVGQLYRRVVACKGMDE